MGSQEWPTSVAWRLGDLHDLTYHSPGCPVTGFSRLMSMRWNALTYALASEVGLMFGGVDGVDGANDLMLETTSEVKVLHAERVIIPCSRVNGILISFFCFPSGWGKLRNSMCKITRSVITLHSLLRTPIFLQGCKNRLGWESLMINGPWLSCNLMLELMRIQKTMDVNVVSDGLIIIPKKGDGGGT